MTTATDCDWPADWGCEDPPDTTPETLTWAVGIAAELLWAMSGRTLGVCIITLDPRRGAREACIPSYALRLPPPAVEVLTVTVDGEPLPTDTWRLDPAGLLVRIDRCPWPSHPAIPVEITYRRGTHLSAAGRQATGVYARELIKACTGDRTCRLPARVVAIARQGVDYQFADPSELADKALTGIPEVDTWLRGVNPHSHVSPPRVWSPDIYPDRLTELGH